MMIDMEHAICHPPLVMYHKVMESNNLNESRLGPNRFDELDANAAGNLIRRRREQLGLSLADVVSRTTVSSPQYLHKLEHGLVHVGRSKHVASLAIALELDGEDIAALSNRTQSMSVVDVRYPTAFQVPIVLAGTYPKIGAYTLARRPNEVQVVDTTQKDLIPGRLYVIVGEKPKTEAPVDKPPAQEGAVEEKATELDAAEKQRQKEDFEKFGHCARAVEATDGSIHFVTDEGIFSSEEVRVFGRITFVAHPQ
ncbi:helix-turn-helix domain-containing protein [Deinococcus radiopugnans ATCC 19172]|uniref:Helix-turn-helix domain-containing protein n=2 Tax=Deinococcus radiopugnans ATCC 19172 TaxID=585398 RepID=A0A5C4YAB0_9DEIO|nr:helix-turn-helix domain-containing protein [Deinococcus radiopugnans ATCC 19172]